MKNLLIILALVVIPPTVAVFIPWQRVTVQVYRVNDETTVDGAPVERQYVRGWLFDDGSILPTSISEAPSLTYQRSYDVWKTPFWKWRQPINWYGPPEIPGSE